MTLEEVIRYERKIEAEEQRKEMKIEFCKKLLSKNMSISDCTGLSESEIQEIQKQG